MRVTLIRLAAAVCLVLPAACGGGDNGGDTGEGAGSTTGETAAGGLVAQTAGYDLAVGPPSRYIVGVFNPERGPVGYGTVHLRFSYLGEKEASGTTQPGPEADAAYIPLPGSPAPPAGTGTGQPAFLPPEERGVYAADVGFDKPGIWRVEVTADLDGRPQTASDAFVVLPDHEVPVPGEPAPRSENLTMTTPGAPPSAIDSRADADRPVPDPELHETTVADALERGRPVLLTISTPTFCVSQFCGPITDMVADLAAEYGDRATFIHIEVWKDFEARQLNEAAKEWIARGQGINEPWVFLIGPDGIIEARWDNVASRPELETRLRELPVIAG